MQIVGKDDVFSKVSDSQVHSVRHTVETVLDGLESKRLEVDLLIVQFVVFILKVLQWQTLRRNGS